MIRMPKMPQPGKKPVAPQEDKLLKDVEASDTPERKAAARKYLDAERAAHKTALDKPLREDRITER
ncbi:MAG: hypothetical protein ACOH16_14015 [Propionibacteriaceae bacterium]